MNIVLYDVGLGNELFKKQPKLTINTREIACVKAQGRLVIEEPIFIYSGSKKQSISKEINEAESEYMNMGPPLNYRSSAFENPPKPFMLLLLQFEQPLLYKQ